MERCNQNLVPTNLLAKIAQNPVIILHRAQRVLDIQVQDALNMNREPQRMGDIELHIQTLNKQLIPKCSNCVLKTSFLYTQFLAKYEC
jgi:hypothetical protein